MDLENLNDVNEIEGQAKYSPINKIIELGGKFGFVSCFGDVSKKFDQN